VKRSSLIAVGIRGGYLGLTTTWDDCLSVDGMISMALYCFLGFLRKGGNFACLLLCAKLVCFVVVDGGPNMPSYNI
jgi:hypothetical protein